MKTANLAGIIGLMAGNPYSALGRPPMPERHYYNRTSCIQCGSKKSIDRAFCSPECSRVYKQVKKEIKDERRTD